MHAMFMAHACIFSLFFFRETIPDENSLVAVYCREDAKLQNCIPEFISTIVKSDDRNDFGRILTRCKATMI